MIFQLLILGVLLWWAGNVVYSLFFSPLRDIPGPLLLQIFPLYYRLQVGKGQSAILLEEYHQAYGPAFRIGWHYVAFADPSASMEIYSTYKYSKTHEYAAFEYHGMNMLSIRNREEHALRRRQIALAFTKQNVALMEPTIVSEGMIPLLGNLSKAVGTSIDVFHQFHYFSWDVVGKLAFGKSFNMLKKGKHHDAVYWMNATIFFGFLCNNFPFLQRFSFPVGEKLRKLISDSLGPQLTSEVFKNSSLSREEMVAESFIQLFGGTDTASNTMTWFFYLIAKHPRVEAKLMEELRATGILEKEGLVSSSDFSDKLPYFEATLKEAMRLLPAAPLTPWRMVPEGGRQIKGYFLPEGTIVGVALFSLNRSPEIWDEPNLFIPERWENFKPREGSFIPFLIGPRACIGKYLGLLELRLVLVNVMKKFRLTLPKDMEEIKFDSFPTLKPRSNQMLMNIELR
ncbi:hypothetical protein DSO57_1025765 [Entomophthora muscae]|uniref:Uncharacterized protein n=1 Tax=Entomophthora muscae TaxID=34485 RepID=A0ACC2RTD1_9FUNG|nr:hypothetical protein DSO57_1025765 [Entomophthora muscae]